MKISYNLPIKLINIPISNTLVLGRLFSKLNSLLTTSINIKYKANLSIAFNKYSNQILKFKTINNINIMPLYIYISKNNLYINIKYLYSMLSFTNKKYFIKYIII